VVTTQGKFDERLDATCMKKGGAEKGPTSIPGNAWSAPGRGRGEGGLLRTTPLRSREEIAKTRLPAWSVQGSDEEKRKPASKEHGVEGTGKRGSSHGLREELGAKILAR